MNESQIVNKNQNFEEIVKWYELKGLISTKVFNKFSRAISNHDHEEFIIQGEIIIRSILIKIIKGLKIGFNSNSGIHSILNIAWNYHIITNERIYAYLWVFARAAQQIRNDELEVESHEALMHASIFFGFLIEINKTINEFPQLKI